MGWEHRASKQAKNAKRMPVDGRNIGVTYANAIAKRVAKIKRANK